MRLKDRFAVVTGAGSGIGRAIALRFAAEGAGVAVADINYEGARAVAAEASQAGGEAFAVEVDVSSRQSVDAMAEKVLKRFGRIDILVNNAGIASVTPFLEIKEEEWDRTQAVNLKGMFLCCQRIVPGMMSRRSGKIVNLGSVSAEAAFMGQSAYCASKGGVISFTRALALELAPHGICVNAISPGIIVTPLSMAHAAASKDPDIETWLLSRIPAARKGQPEDIASVAVFLASSDSDYMNGANVVVDGGWLAQ